MLRQFTLNLTLLIFGSDIALTLLALRLAKSLRLTLPYGERFPPEYLDFPWIIYLIVAAVWSITFLIIPVYNAKVTFRAIDQMQTTITAIGFATLVFAGIAYFFFRDLSRFLFLYFFILDLIFLLSLRIILRIVLRVWRGGWPGRKARLLILGANQVGIRLGHLLQDNALYGVDVVGYLDDDASKRHLLPDSFAYLGSLDQAIDTVRQRQVDEVVLALPSYEQRHLVDIVQRLQSLTIKVHVVPDLFELSFVRTSVEDFEGIPLIRLGEPAMDSFQQFVKRGFDLIVASCALIFAFPVMSVIALWIKLDSDGPVFYTPERVGQNGRMFRMFKFRSMVSDAEHRRSEVLSYTEDGKPLFKHPDDPRITKFGRFLRRTSLDELPQLFNVLKGDMSLIGPRPEMPWLVELYEPWQYKRFCVPQGMTGWWQVNGRSDKPLHLHVEEDLYYIQNYSLLLDVLILWKTVAAVVKRSGAY